ncbi:MAG: hypothetical protein JWO89_2460 [Verrucomicrobiaceae bacterium]|nr:hypothetical protein [Verrucomicrobiaceae bacterium]MDB6117939.1 hypothetical protein [Verrucomicrobiaceae bacterium]
MKNKNLQRYAHNRASVEEHLASRLPKALRKQFVSTKSKLWWRYPVYRRAKPVTDVDGNAVTRLLDEDGTQTNLFGEKVPATRFMTPGEQQELYRLVAEHRPKFSVEVGLAAGYSTLSMLQAIADKKCGKLLSIDPFQISDFKGAGLMNVRRAGLDDFHLWWERMSHYSLPILAESGAKVDFALIDGNHLFDYTLTEFYYLDRILKREGCMVFHDYRYPAVRACLNFIEANFPYKVMPTAEPNIRVLIKENYDQRPWYYFKPFNVPQIAWTALENREMCE